MTEIEALAFMKDFNELCQKHSVVIRDGDGTLIYFKKTKFPPIYKGLYGSVEEMIKKNWWVITKDVR